MNIHNITCFGLALALGWTGSGVNPSMQAAETATAVFERNYVYLQRYGLAYNDNLGNNRTNWIETGNRISFSELNYGGSGISINGTIDVGDFVGSISGTLDTLNGSPVFIMKSPSAVHRTIAVSTTISTGSKNGLSPKLELETWDCPSITSAKADMFWLGPNLTSTVRTNLSCTTSGRRGVNSPFLDGQQYISYSSKVWVYVDPEGWLEIDVGSYYKVVPGLNGDDELVIEQANPVPDLALKPGSDQSFSANISYTLNSHNSANLLLRLLDQNGNVLGASDVWPVNHTDGARNVALRIPPGLGTFRIPTSVTQLDLEAVLLDSANGQAFKESAVFHYPVRAGLMVKAVKPSVAPNSQAEGFFQEPLTVSITGSNFAPGCILSLGPAIQVSAVRFKSPTEVEADLSGFGGLSKGPRDVVVTNPTGEEARGAGLFYVSDLLVSELELNQGVPMDGSVAQPAIADHNTAVRVRLICNGASCDVAADQALGWLHVLKDGLPVAGSPFAPDAPIQVRSQSNEPDWRTRFYAQDTLDYYFNDRNALGEGDYDFKFEFDPRHPNVLPPRSLIPNLNSNLVKTVQSRSFRSSRSSQGLRCAVLVDGNRAADIAEALSYFDFLAAAYPISQGLVRFEYRQVDLSFTTEANTIAALKAWHDQQKLGNAAPFTHVFLFTRNPAFTDAGLSDCGRYDYVFGLISGTFFCRSPAIIVKLRGDDTRGTIAHELGHNFLLGDTYQGASQTSANNPADGAACQSMGNGCPVEDGLMDTILRNVSVVLRDRPSFTGPTKRDFMGNASRVERWVNRSTWNYLYPKFNLALPGGNPDSPATEMTAGSGSDWIVISGAVTTNFTAELAPCLRYRGTRDASDIPTGGFRVELQNAQGQTLVFQDFALLFGFASDNPRPEPQVPFSVTLPFLSNAARVVLKKDAVELASRVCSSHAPNVTVISPNGGESISGIAMIRWTASDADGDPLSYSVFYSSDGADWTPLTVNLTRTNWAWDTRLSPGTTAARIKVVANDGINQGSDMSDAVFTVASKAPAVFITSPTNGAVLTPNQPVLFQGAAFDPDLHDQGDLTLVFNSDRDGLLGYGSQVWANTLSVGTHRITLSATDSSQSLSSATVTVVVAAPGNLPRIDIVPDTLDFAAVPLGQSKDLQMAIRNVGSGILSVTQIIADNSQFKPIDPPTPFQVNANGTQFATVRFVPETIETDHAILQVASSDPSQPLVQVNLVGSGQTESPCAQLPMGLVGWWSGDGTTDLVGTNHAVLNNGATFAPGLIGQAFQFDGVDDFADLGPWTPGKEWSLEAWVNPAKNSNGRKGIIGSFYGCADWGLVLMDGNFGAGIRPPTGCSQTVSSGITALPGTWYHLVATCDGISSSIYVDGVLCASGRVDSDFPGTAAGVRIGGEVCCGGNNFAGLVDEAAVYDRALTTAEVGQLYRAGEHGKCIDDLAHPRLEVSPSSVDFGGLLVGQNREMGLTLNNRGNASLVVESITTGNAQFEIVSNRAPFTVAAKSSYQLKVRFTPNATGLQQSALRITSSDPLNHALTTRLAGIGAGKTLAGDLTGTLNESSSPYLVVGNVYVPAGRTLSLEPGVFLCFANPDTSLVVDGVLAALGTSAKPITFTSDQADKRPGQWGVVVFRGTNGDAATILEQCVIECGAASGVSSETVRFEGASPTLRRCVVRLSRIYGLNFMRSDARIEQCQFTANGGYPMAMRIDSFPALQNNTASSNNPDAIAIYDAWTTRSGRWRKDNLPYTLLNYVGVSQDQSLTIEPGVTIQFQNPGDSFLVDGGLIAQGTSDQPITITSDETAKAPGQWGALIFRAASSKASNLLEYCLIECGAAEGVANETVRIESSSPVLRHCTIRGSRAYGLSFLGSDAQVEDCIFEQNGNAAMLMRIDSYPRLRNNRASQNGLDAIGVYDAWTSRSGRWVKDNPPYTLLNYVGVSRGHVLTIDPGVIIQFQNSGDNFLVDGGLMAQGTAELPIRFTSDKSAKQPGQWGALAVRSGSLDASNIIEHCWFECGAAAGVADEMVRVENASPTFRKCTISRSRLNGLNLLGSDARVEGCVFADNGNYAMVMRADSSPFFSHNAADHNTYDAIGIYDAFPNRSVTWRKDDLPYSLINYFGVSTGKTLTIEPGVIVQFTYPDESLLIDGTLAALGTAEQPIVFTSSQVRKQPGQWQQIAFRDASDDAGSIMNYCIVEYGGQNAQGSLCCYSASPRILNTVVRRSLTDGIYLDRSTPAINWSKLVSNERDGLRTVNSAVPTVVNCLIAGNGGFGLNNLDPQVILSAENNFWGNSNGPFDNANIDGLNLLNPSGLGQKVSEYVDWSPVSSQDPSSEVRYSELRVSPASATFGQVGLGQTATLSLSLSNAGSTVITVRAVASDNPEFGAVTSLPLTIAAGSARDLVVRFAPSMAGFQAGTLSVISDSVVEPEINAMVMGSGGPNAGLLGEFYQFKRTLDYTPNVIGVTPDFVGVFKQISFSNSVSAFTSLDGIVPQDANSSVFLDNFAARFRGTVQVQTTGDYEFRASSDDGLVLKINGQVVLSQNAPGGYRTVLGRVNLAAGAYPIELDYFEQGGYAGLDCYGHGPGGLAYSTNMIPAAIEVSVSAGFKVSTFTEGIGFPTGLAYRAGGASAGTLLVGDTASSGGTGVILSYDALGIPTPRANLTGAPIALAWGDSSQFDGDVLVADDYIYGRDLPSPGNRDIGADRVRRLKSDGTVPELVGNAGPTGLALGGGDFGADLLVADVYGHRILKVSSAGTATDFANGHAFQSLALSVGGALGSSLFAGDFEHPCVYRVHSSGISVVFATNTPCPVGIAVDPSGRFGGDLFVASFVPDRGGLTLASQPSGKIYRVRPDGSVSVFAQGLRFRSYLSGDLAFGFEGDLFVLEDGRERVLRISPSTVALPAIEIDPTRLDFGPVTNGQTLDLTLALRNRGQAALEVRSWSIADYRFSVVAPMAPFTLAAGMSANVMVRFAPLSSGLADSELVIENNDPRYPALKVTLAGTGVNPGECAGNYPGIVAWYPADGNAKDIVGGNDGIATNGLDFALGRYGQAFRFDGTNDYLATPLDVSPTALPVTTWEAWVYPTRLNYGSRQQILSDDDGGYDRSLLIEGSSANFGVFTGYGVWIPTNASPNQWQHVAVVFDRDHIEFYKNGVRFQLNTTLGSQATSFKLQIGRNPGFGECFQGLIDEVAIYDRALSPDEIRALYQAGGAVRCGGETNVFRGNLAIKRGRDQLVISWPSQAWNPVLQTTGVLGPSTNWATEPTTPVLQNGVYSVTLTSGVSNRPPAFFRLKGTLSN
jgi:hypothetical protein